METVTKKTKGLTYLAKEIRVLKIVGLSFNDDEGIIYKMYSFFIVFCVNVTYPALQLKELFQQDFEVVSDMLMYVAACYVSLAKMIVVHKNRIAFRKMLERLEQEPFTVNLERGGIQEEKLLQECFWITDVQANVYWAVGYSTIFGNMVYSVVKRLSSSDYHDWELPFGPLNILNVTHSPSYEATLFYEDLGITCLATYFFTVDLLMATVLAHICCQFKMLQNNIKRILLNCYIDMEKDKAESIHHLMVNNPSHFDVDPSTIPWPYLHKHLQQAVSYHLEITRLAKDMEDVFSTLLLTIFLGTLGIICFSVFQASVVQDNLKVVINIFVTCTSSFQVFVVCYWGELVVHESLEVGHAAYEVNFAGTDLRFQKGLAMIIRRSQNSTKLTAGKFTDICLSTFTWIVRTSYSAFMVLKSNTAST